MKRNKIFGNILLFATLIVFAGINDVPIHAETTSEVESNDTMDTANTITETTITEAEAIDADYSNQHVVNGTSSTSDIDWFKVYLSAGTNYITCNEYAFNAYIYDSSNTEIYYVSYAKATWGARAYSFSVSSDGYYYIKIVGATSSSTRYLFCIGEPTFSYSSYSTSLGSISMTGSDESITCDFSAITTIPDNSVVYTASISGVLSSKVSSFSLYNFSTDTTTSLNLYTKQATGLVSLNMPVKDSWTVSFGYKKAVTITPTLNLYYIYPVTSSMEY